LLHILDNFLALLVVGVLPTRLKNRILVVYWIHTAFGGTGKSAPGSLDMRSGLLLMHLHLRHSLIFQQQKLYPRHKSDSKLNICNKEHDPDTK
jgi:hypothetical protein